MIEIICKEGFPKEETAETRLCLPRNIRQIGSPRGRHKIYIEDYVYTYLKAAAGKKESCAAIFLGDSQTLRDIRYTFVSGALECGEDIFRWDGITLDRGFWDGISEEQKKYFPEKNIVGWFLGRAGQEMELPAVAEAAHRKYFAGRDKLLMLMDAVEGEEAFYVYEQGYLQKREGYYIYYEKNLPMQEYMIHRREEELRRHELAVVAVQDEEEEFAKLRQELGEGSGPGGTGDARAEGEKADGGQPEGGTSLPEDLPAIKSNSEGPKTHAEEALESYRYAILEKQGKRLERQSRNFLYTAASFFLVVVSVIGITTINNYRKMQEVEETLSTLGGAAESGAERRAESEGLVVESVASQVSPSGDGAQGENAGGAEGSQAKTSGEDAQGSAGSREKAQKGSAAESPKADRSQTGGAQDDKKAEPGSEQTEETSEGQTGSAQDAADGQEGNDLGGEKASQPGGQEEGQPDEPEETGQSGSQEASGQPGGQETSQTEGQEDSPSGGKEGGQPDGQEASQSESREDGQPEGGEDSGDAGEPAAAPAAPRYYTVKKGDTLAAICLSIYHSLDKMQQLCEANGIEDGDKIYVGQKLELP